MHLRNYQNISNKKGIIFILLIIFISCNTIQRNKDDTNNRINILKILKSNKKTFNGDKIINKIELIQLETNNNCLVGYIEKLRADSNNIYILDNQKNLTTFNSVTGENIFSINSKGKGPGEYIDITDFAVSQNGKLAIADMSLRKILIYNNHGQFQKEIKLSSGLMSLSFLNDSILILYIPSQLNRQKIPYINCVNINSELITTIRKFNYITNNSHYLKPCDFNRFRENLYIKVPFCDTIFFVTKTNLTPYKYIDYSGKDIPVKLFSNMKKYTNNRTKYIEWSDYFETENYFFFTVLYKEELKRGIINKKTNEFSLIKSNNINTPGLRINKLKNYYIWPEDCNDIFFTTHINAITFMKSNIHLNNMDSMSINNNPIIIKCYFNK